MSLAESLRRAWIPASVLLSLLVGADPACGRVSFSGVVRDAESRPIEGADVTLRTLGGSSLRVRTQTDTDGRYRLELLEPARGYWFIVSKENYRSVSASFEPGLERTRLDPKFEKSFTLHPIGSVSLPRDEPPALVVQRSTRSRSYAKGLKAFDSGNWEAARKNFEKALLLAPDSVQVRRAAQEALAIVYYRLGDHAAAAEAAETALGWSPGDPTFLRIQYDSLRDLGDEAGARRALLALVEADPGEGTARLFHNEGVGAALRADLELAEAMFEAALRLVPDLVQTQDALAKVYVQQRQYAGAAAAAEAVWSTDPSNISALRILYEACQALRDRDGAQEALEALVVRDPGPQTATLLYNEGVRAFNAEDTETAEQIFLRALSLDSTHVDASLGLAEVYLRQRRVEEALAMARKVLEKDPGNSAALRIEEMIEAAAALTDPPDR